VSAEGNKAVIRRLIEEVYNEGNLDVVDELMAPDIFDHAAVPEHQHGIDGFKHVMEWVREFSSDVHYDIDDIIAEGEKVAVRMTQSGTHTGQRGVSSPLARVSRSTTFIGSVLRTGRLRRCGP
jgi:predicted ester cyclase